MPELPEVETITQYLAKRILKKKILNLNFNTPRIFRDHATPKEVEKQIVGARIKNIKRIGKNIIFQLSNKRFLLIHLMMTGKILLNPTKIQPHDRFTLVLSGNTTVVFNDVRKFGRCRVVSSLDNLFGTDATAITFPKFQSLLARKTKVKAFLLNQKLVAGIGNIYADEILWYAGISPRRTADSLDQVEIHKLFQSMQKVIRIAIKAGGTSSRNYRKPDDQPGDYYPLRRAYHRTGELCGCGKGEIERTIIAQRSTHFCPSHQV